MEIQPFSFYYPYQHVRTSNKSNFDDLPSFEEAFKSDDLRRFYQNQRLQAQMAKPSADYFSMPNNDDFMRDEMSMADDQETQASPLLTRYIQKFNQDVPMNESQFSVNLAHQFYSDSTEMITEPIYNSLQFSHNPYESPLAKPFTTMTPQQAFNRVPEVKKVVEMKGNLNMTMSFGNFTVKGGAQDNQSNERTPKTNKKHSIMEETAAFERVLKAKKIFKIQRDTKPKMPVKQKISFQQQIDKARSPQQQTIKFPISALTTGRGDFIGQNNMAYTEGEQGKTENIQVANFLSAMQGKGYSPQQIMSQIQKLMHQNIGEHSPNQKI
jgi:hypothetical protein